MSLRPELIILITVIVRWAIRNYGKNSYNRNIKPRFKEKGLKNTRILTPE
jgi:hypothetical protein